MGTAQDQILTRTVASGANAGLAAYLTDYQGSVRDILQASTGTVQTHVDYSGFGTATVVGCELRRLHQVHGEGGRPGHRVAGQPGTVVSDIRPGSG